MRPAALLVLLSLALPASAATRFVTPVDGAQVFGATVLQIDTDAAGVNRVEYRVDGELVGVARTAPWRVLHDFGTSLRACTITADVVFADYSRRETATIQSLPIENEESIAVDLVTIPVRVESDRALSPQSFVVRENGVRQDILEVTPRRPAAKVTFVVDRSASMNGNTLAEIRNAIQSSLAQLRTGDSPSIILFNHRVERRKAIEGRVLSLRAEASGGTSLRDAVAAGASEGGVVIVISDGRDRNSALDAAAAWERVVRRDCTVHALALGGGDGAAFLEKVAEATGGKFRRASVSELGSGLAAIMRDMNSRHVISYQSSNHDRGWRAISVESADRAVRVSGARRGYVAE